MLLILETHTVPHSIAQTRLLDYCLSNFQTIRSRAGIKKVIKRGEVLLDNHPVTGAEWLQSGQRILLIDREESPPKPYDLALEVVYEDDFIAVINKPAGISVSGNKFRTIQNALLSNLKVSEAPDALKWPRPVHRLDYGTSGLLLVAKTRQAVAALGAQFEQRQIKKKYIAVVVGKPKKEGVITQQIDGKEAVTRFRVLCSVKSVFTKWVSLMELFPETGRTHQIRIHMAGIGHPMLGDDKYGSEHKLLKHKGLFLAAVGIDFIHPVSGEAVSLSLDIPYKFGKRLETERRRWKKYHND